MGCSAFSNVPSCCVAVELSAESAEIQLLQQGGLRVFCIFGPELALEALLAGFQRGQAIPSSPSHLMPLTRLPSPIEAPFFHAAGF